MKYDGIREAKFLERPNRFIARVLIDGKEEIAHVKNTGRCKELLTPNATIYLQDFRAQALEGKRKTSYDLVGVKKGNILINMDSQIPNKVVKEAFNNDIVRLWDWHRDTLAIKGEQTFGNSRFDFFVEDHNFKAFVEVKGVTLEEDGTVLFPDAPTMRGVKHIEELMVAKEEGYKTFLILVAQMEEANSFSPNYRTHPEFGETLKKAQKNGTKVLAYNCYVTEDSISIKEEIPVIL